MTSSTAEGLFPVTGSMSPISIWEDLAENRNFGRDLVNQIRDRVLTGDCVGVLHQSLGNMPKPSRLVHRDIVDLAAEFLDPVSEIFDSVRRRVALDTSPTAIMRRQNTKFDSEPDMSAFKIVDYRSQLNVGRVKPKLRADLERFQF